MRRALKVEMKSTTGGASPSRLVKCSTASSLDRRKQPRQLGQRHLAALRCCAVSRRSLCQRRASLEATWEPLSSPLDYSHVLRYWTVHQPRNPTSLWLIPHRPHLSVAPPRAPATSSTNALLQQSIRAPAA
ncbi:hypothetical protein VTK73DRAFT_4483 [Phialemonium thermophilum]|uniref:Uncharacterized protein n=1 Tax=Phialemonium thermophilum TaxID=223376 RepID=A0ABR3VA81_9PEZI